MSAEAIAAPARPRHSPQHLDLLLVVSQLLRLDLFKGEKRERLHRAFIGSAVYLGKEIMPDLEGRLPTTAKDAALELHASAIDLCLRAGLSRRDLTEHYNEHGERGTFLNGGVAEAAKRMLALLSIFYARDLTGGQS